jgi:hypothetical protein
VDETNVKSWPRPRLTPEQDKIFFIGGPTRKDPRFFFGRSPRHMDYALLPKASIDCKKAADVINTWFSDKGTLLGLIIGGRWNAGVKQLENCPIDAELKENLSELKSPSPINSW